MGSLKKAFKSYVSFATLGLVGGGNPLKNAVNAASLGAIDMNKKKTPQVSGAPIQDLQQEKEETRKKRRALFVTEGEALGQEVDEVGSNKRGSIFGNYRNTTLGN